MLRRRLSILLAVALVVAGVAGCRTSPSVAAYVGEAQVSVAQLRTAVDQRLADPDVAAFAEGAEDDFSRQVLSLLVQEEIYRVLADRYDVTVTDAAVTERIEVLLDGADPAEAFAQLAQQQGVGRADVVENVRQQLIRQQVAVAEGLAAGVSEAELRAQYVEQRAGLAQYVLGLITTPDQASADAVLAQLTADPAAYPALAAQYAGEFTLPAVESRSPEELPEVLAGQVTAAAPGTGFTVPLAEAGGVVVGFVTAVTYPEFEDVQPRLAEEAAAQAEAAATQLVTDVREELDVTVNPRYGVLEEDAIVPVEGGVVSILGDAADAADAEVAPAPAPTN